MKKLNKISVATIQFENAIEAFHNGNELVAITLAGASEEILGKLCRRKNIDNSVEALALIAEEKGLELTKKNTIKALNHARDSLKHADYPVDDDFEIFDCDAQVMLARTAINYMKLDLPLTEKN